MFCPKCGRGLPDESKFCSMCGATIAELMPNAANEDDISKRTTEEALVGTSIPAFVQPKKKNSSKKPIIAAIAVVAALAIAWGIIGLLQTFNKKNAYVYLSDGKYMLITDLDQKQDIEIATSKTNTTMASLISFSPDGKYLYYYTKYDSDSKTGTLCRAEYRKLKENSNINDKYIDIIAANVSLGFRFLDDGSVIYENSEESLFYFDGKNETRIAKNVSTYFTDGAKRVIYATGDISEGYTLYGVELDDIDHKNKLASNVAEIQTVYDLNNILYTKNEDDGNKSLYVVGFQTESKQIAKRVHDVIHVENKTYFTAESGVMLSLYDFVKDAYADIDVGITEPNIDDFSEVEYTIAAMNRKYSIESLSDGEIEELLMAGNIYATTTNPLPQYNQSMISLIEDYKEKQDNIYIRNARQEMQKFVENFSAQEDEWGYILVTDAVKESLQNIANSWANPKQRDWLKYCYVEYPSGTTTDFDAYNAAKDKWNEAKSRIKLREELKNEENNIDVCTLYCFDNGSLTAVNDSVLDVKSYSGAIIFNTAGQITEELDLANVSSVSEVKKLFNINCEAENDIILSNGSACRMSATAAETFAEAYEKGYATLFFGSNTVYMSESNGVLSIANIDSGVVGDFSIVADDAQVLSVDGSTLYYASGSYENDGITYCDLYSCKDGTSTRMARDVILNSINLYSDGVILAYTGYRSDSGFELTMIDSEGKTTLVGEDITRYIRVDKTTLLYISDGDLYSYNGKEKKMVRSEVAWIWSQNSMKIDKTFISWRDYGYDYYN